MSTTEGRQLLNIIDTDSRTLFDKLMNTSDIGLGCCRSRASNSMLVVGTVSS